MKIRRKTSVISWLILLGFPSIVLANPSNPQVIKGHAVFSQPSKSTLHVKTEDKTIINWKDFSIGSGELTKFVQSSKNSTVLNRVVSGNPSAILGTLESNGKIYLINPNGLLVGKEGVINTASFVSSTFDILDDDFLQNSEILFAGDSKSSIVNYGTITAWDGDVTLIGYTVDNQNKISAPNGTVAIGAGQEVLLKPGSDEKIFIRHHLTAEKNSNVGLSNSGQIEALQTELKADGNAYALAINHSGRTDALQISEKGGRIFLVAEGGTTDLSGELFASGGEVKVLGDRVHLSDKAQIDTSSDQKGGNIYVGGGLNGKDQTLYNAKQTTIDSGAIIHADSKVSGEGGQVIVWSSKETQFHGQISAKAGADGGNGGFVEVSGKSLTFNGSVSTQASKGDTGTLLLDPTDIYIQDPGSLTLTATSGSGFVEYSDTVGAPVGVLPTSVLNAQLAATNVVVTTTSTSDNNGDIFINGPATPINWNNANTLTLDADRDIILKNEIIPGNNSTVNILAGRDFVVHDDGTLNTTNFTSVNINTGRDMIFNDGITWQQHGNFNVITDRDITFGERTGFVVLNDVGATQPINEAFVAGKNISIGKGSAFTLQDSPLFKSHNFDLESSSFITVNQSSPVGNQTLQIKASNDINISHQSGITANISNILIDARHHVKIGASGNITSNSGGSSTINAGQDISFGPSVIINKNQGGDFSLNAGKDISFGSTVVVNENQIGNVTLTAGKNILMGSSNEFLLPQGGNLTMIADKSIISSNSLTIVGSTNTAVTLVSDNSAPNPPCKGHGYISIPNASITAAEGIKLYSARRSDDDFYGAEFNGVEFQKGPKYVNTPTEQWGAYYPDEFGGTPYTSFYKEQPKRICYKTLFKFYAATTEPFQFWRGFDRFEYGYDFVSFNCDDEGEAICLEHKNFWTIPFQVVDGDGCCVFGNQYVGLLEDTHCYYNLRRANLRYGTQGPVNWITQRPWACAE